MATQPAQTSVGGTIAHEHDIRAILTGSVDPSADAGVVAPIGTLYARNTGTAGTLWIKAGATATDWKLITQAA